MDLTYHSYLKVEELLSLQELQSPQEHDEMLFIIIHQSYELWFKQMLHELDFVCAKLAEGNLDRAGHNLRRSLTILKVLVHQVDILETMTPLEFLSFRDYLQSASGFQSYQWRELEFLLGVKTAAHFARFPEGSAIRQRLERRYREPSLWQWFLAFLRKTGYDVPEPGGGLPDDASSPHTGTIRKTLTDIYLHSPPVARFCELLVDLDEGMQEWRYRHVKMVERTIGNKKGTGGSSGVDYLRATLFNPVFPDLWAIRTDFRP